MSGADAFAYLLTTAMACGTAWLIGFRKGHSRGFDAGYDCARKFGIDLFSKIIMKAQALTGDSQAADAIGALFAAASVQVTGFDAKRGKELQ